MPSHRTSYAGLAALTLCALPSVNLNAQSEAPDALEDLIVTASRSAVSRSSVGASFTVVTREMLEARQHKLVVDALRETPGVAVSGGGFGAITQARLRGAEGNHTLVLIDGIEANNPVSNSEFDFANLLVTDIERIEILRGAQSALYGSDAVGGVINVITRRPTEGGQARLRAEAGNAQARELGFSLSGASGRFAGGIAAARFETDGENVSRFGSERDGYANDTVSMNGSAELGERFTLEATLRRIEAERDFDSQDFSPDSPTQGLVIDDDVTDALEQWFYRVQGTASAVGSPWLHRFGVSRMHTETRFFDGGEPTGANEGEKTKLDFQSVWSIDPAQTLILAIEREQIDYENRGASPVSPENQSQSDEQTSFVAEYQIRIGRTDLSLSGRRDENDLFDDASTYRLTASFAASARTRLHASLGTGIANPGFFELFGFFPGSFIGNPDLRPEKSESIDVGIERRFADDRLALDVTYFRADLKDEIETTFDPDTFLSTVINLPGESERRGVEVALSAGITATWELGASYTYTDAAQPDGLAELRRPRHAASLQSTWVLGEGRGRVHAGVAYNGEQQDTELVFATPEERVTLDAYTLVRLSGDYRLSPRWRLYGRIENLFDETYEQWFSYRSPGRTAFAGVELTFAE